MSQISFAVAGSLAPALSEFAQGFSRETGHAVSLRRGPAGLLTRAILDGFPAQVFVSASPDGPAALQRAGLFGPARLIARNRTVLVARPGLAGEDPLDLLADPGLRIAMSTPGADPGGDYAAAFLDRLTTGDPARWQGVRDRCASLFGATLPDPDAPTRSPATEVLRENRADLLIVYATTGAQIMQALPRARALPLPPELAPLTRICACARIDAPDAAQAFLGALQGPDCAATLLRHGFIGV